VLSEQEARSAYDIGVGFDNVVMVSDGRQLISRCVKTEICRGSHERAPASDESPPPALGMRLHLPILGRSAVSREVLSKYFGTLGDAEKLHMLTELVPRVWRRRSGAGETPWRFPEGF
jgi:hypothetical protein